MKTIKEKYQNNLNKYILMYNGNIESKIGRTKTDLVNVTTNHHCCGHY